jgi:putative MATE family efflux protein
MNPDRSEQLGQGSIPRLLLRFALPAVVGLMAQGLYNVIDRVFVGRALGELGIAGITVSFPFMLVMLAFGMLVGFGATALISIRLGEQKKDEAERILGNAAVLLAGVSLAVTVVGLLWLDPILRLFGASEAVLPYAREYLRIIVLGNVLQTVGFGLNATIRGEGNPRVAMLSMLLGVAMNVVLAPLFIFGFHWGMRGAAWATVCAEATVAVWVIAYFLGRTSTLRFRTANLRLQRDICKSIVAIGAPACALQLAASVFQGLLFHQLGVYGGDAAISVMGIVFAVITMFAMPVFGINQGAQPIIGYNHGAERFDRVKKSLETAIVAASVVTTLGFTLSMLFPGQVVRLFAKDQNEVLTLLPLGARALRICACMWPIVGFQIVSAGYFQAVGKPRMAMLLMLSRQVILLIPAVLILPCFFALDGVWASLPTADFISSVWTGVFLVWELRHLHERHQTTAFEAAESVEPFTPM